MTTLYVDTTARYQHAAASELCARIIVENGAPVIYRPISQNLYESQKNWPEAYFTDQEDRTTEQHTAIEDCETLGAEFFFAKDIVINLPLVGGEIPASFKAWIELIALADPDLDDECAHGFRDKHATLIVAAGGLKVGSEMDSLTPQLISMLDFIGVNDVEILSADQTSPSGAAHPEWHAEPTTPPAPMPLAA